MSTEAKNLKQVDEVELAFRLMESDESVLAEILVNFGSSVIALIGKKYATLSHEDAEDVFSIALNKLWKNRQNYDDSKGKLRSYLFRIADNTALDIFKYGWAKARVLEVDAGETNEFDLVPDQSPPPDETKRQRKDREKKYANETNALKAIIESLPEKQQEIVLADIYARDRVAESATLADELDIAVSSVRVYRLRAWKTIRTKMKELGYELPPEGEADGN